MNLRDYYHSLDDEAKAAFAADLNRSVEYLRIHLFPKNGPPHRTPPLSVLERMAEITKGKVSLAEVLEHFSKKRRYAA